MIKRLLFPLVLCLLIISSLSSCKKETVSPTPAEVTANEIKTVMKRIPSGRIYPLKYGQPTNSFNVTQGTSWSISNGFFVVETPTGVAYNLAYLVSYNVARISLSDGSSTTALLLYFE